MGWLDLAGARSTADSRSAREMRIMRSSTSRCSEDVDGVDADAGVRAEALKVSSFAATPFVATLFAVARGRSGAWAAAADAAEDVVALSMMATSRGESVAESGRMLCRSDIPMASCCNWSSTWSSSSDGSSAAAEGLGASFARCVNSEVRKERRALRSMSFAGKVSGFHILAHTWLVCRAPPQKALPSKLLPLGVLPPRVPRQPKVQRRVSHRLGVSRLRPM